MKAFVCDACSGPIDPKGPPTATRLCDDHLVEYDSRKLRVPPGNILSKSRHDRIERAVTAGLRCIATQPVEVQEWLLNLLVSAEGNGGVGSVRGMPHTDGPHGQSASYGVQRSAVMELAASVGGQWSASARTWDHIVYLQF